MKNKVIIPYVCCNCKIMDATIIDEKEWLRYKYKKEFLIDRNKDTLCSKCSKRYLK